MLDDDEVEEEEEEKVAKPTTEKRLGTSVKQRRNMGL